MRNANNQWKVTGNQATPAEFPWVVAVFYEGEYLVGGSLIAPGVVLTVADPLMDTSATKMVVRAAEWDMNSEREPFPYEERLVEKIVSHEDFHFTTGANNLALLFLKSKFQLKYQIATICLPSIESSFEEYGCIVAGWGRTKFTDRNNSAILKKINLPLVNTRTCEHRLKQTEELGWEYNLPKSLICAGAELNQDACIGDGGSALFCPIGGHNSNTYVQVGIVNWGIECGKENVPGTYTNVAMFAEWIKQKLLIFNYR
uniref:Phenoloxidase-activating factor 2 n=1 Tax=Drosophila rhopaloa TaxID=1041015 RepID=A0A6P4F154_DRORH